MYDQCPAAVVAKCHIEDRRRRQHDLQFSDTCVRFKCLQYPLRKCGEGRLPERLGELGLDETAVSLAAGYLERQINRWRQRGCRLFLRTPIISALPLL